jgi:glucose-1-phosphate thymidylyltransferase
VKPDRQSIATPQDRQGLKGACPEEIACRSGWIDAEPVQRLAPPTLKNGIGRSPMKLLSEKAFR